MTKHILSTLILISMITHAHTATAQNPTAIRKPLQNELLPFQSDGCTSWPDTIGEKDYTLCCLQHDYSYWAGGTKKQKLQADLDLRACVNKVFGGPIGMGDVMFGGTYAAGKFSFTNVYRWGFGWKYYRSTDSPLTESEKNMVVNLTPSNLISAVLKYKTPEELASMKIESYLAEPYPSLSGNYCIDEVLEKIAQNCHNITKIDLKYSKNENQHALNIRTNLCKNEIVAIFNVPTLQICSEPYYSVYPSNFLQLLHGFGDCNKIVKP